MFLTKQSITSSPSLKKKKKKKNTFLCKINDGRVYFGERKALFLKRIMRKNTHCIAFHRLNKYFMHMYGKTRQHGCLRSACRYKISSPLPPTKNNET